MNTNLLQKEDQDTNRRRALAKVYRFLIRLAEEAQEKIDSPGTVDTNQCPVDAAIPVTDDPVGQ